MEDEAYSIPSENLEGQSGPGRGCIVFLVVILVLLLLCCCLIVGLTGLYYVSPEFNDMITGLLNSFLVK